METDAGGAASSYTYAPSGLRVSKTVDGTWTDFILDGDNVVLELVGGAVTAKYIRGLNLPNIIRQEMTIENTDRINTMHIWTIDNWKEHYSENNRSGLRIRFEKTLIRK